MTVTDWFPGQSVTGFIADPGSSFNPVVDGYPTSNPSTDFTAKDEGFAGVIHGAPPGGGATLNLYCIDIDTDTWGGIGYALGSWDASNVQNVGYVARILNEYYPNTNQPVLANDNETAAAVQAAIWFFSDRYVLNTWTLCTTRSPPSRPRSSKKGRWFSRHRPALPSPRRR